MTTIESDITKSPYSDEKIFSILSDLNNLERVKDRIPQDKVKNMTFDRDTFSFEVADAPSASESSNGSLTRLSSSVQTNRLSPSTYGFN